MKIGILGATGFIGKNLVEYLKIHGESVEGCSRRTGVDARNKKDLVNWIKSNNITHLVNLAAECGGIGLNQKQPADLWSATTAISHSVLEAALETKIEKTIMVGTVCSYPKNCPVPFKEEYLLYYGEPEPTNRAYGIAKLNSLYGAQSYAVQYGLNVACLIPVNMYGRYDNFDDNSSHVMPAIIKKFLIAKKNNLPSVTLWGTGSSTREFLHAKDFSKAIHSAILNLNDSQFINIGTGREISIKDLSLLIAKLIGFTGEIIWDITKPDGQQRRCLDISRAKKLLDYSPSINLEDGIIDTIDWYSQSYLT